MLYEHISRGGPGGCTPLARPTIKIVRQARHGKVLVKPTSMEICEINDIVRYAPSAAIFYQPNKGFLGTDTFSYKIIYPKGTIIYHPGMTNTQQVTVRVGLSSY